MPSTRKLGAAAPGAIEPTTAGVRAQIAREYDDYLIEFVPGDYVRADLAPGEQRSVVRARLHAAARRRGLRLQFQSGGDAALIFRVEAAPRVAVAPAVEPVPPPAPAPIPTRQRNAPSPRDTTPRRRPEQRASSADRYREMLPRWMRDGGRTGRNGGKRRPR